MAFLSSALAAAPAGAGGSAAPACSRCGSTNIVVDEDQRCDVCASCGFVLGDNALRTDDVVYDDDGAVGMRVRAGDDGGRAARMALGGGGPAGASARRLFRDRAGTPAADAARRRANQLGSTLKLSAVVSAEVGDLLARAAGGRWGSGRWAELLAGACAFVVVRQNNLAVTLPEIAAAVSCDHFAVARTARRVAVALEVSMPAWEPEALLRRALGALPQLRAGAPLGGRAPPAVAAAIRLVRFAAERGLSTGRQPRALAAASLVLAAEGAGTRLDSTAAGEALHVSPSIVEKRLAELRVAVLAFAREVLPWADDVSPRTLHLHLPFILTALQKVAPTGGDEGAAPPAFARSVAARERMTAKIAAAQRRIGGEDAAEAGALVVVPSEMPVGPSLAAQAEQAAKLALQLAPPRQTQPRGQKRMRPLGGKVRRLRKDSSAARAAAAAAAAANGGSDASDGGALAVAQGDGAAAAASAVVLVPLPAEELDEEDEEVEALLRAGVPAARIAEGGLIAARASLSAWQPSAAAVAAAAADDPIGEDDIPDDELGQFIRTEEEAQLVAMLRQHLLRPGDESDGELHGGDAGDAEEHQDDADFADGGDEDEEDEDE